MIDPVTTQMLSQSMLRAARPQDGSIDGMQRAAGAAEISPSGLPGGKTSDSFSDVIGDLIRSVDEKSKVADSEVRRLMVGESDNIHQSMIAMQESGLAFGMLVEVRNKLVESYQELMRMPV